MRLTICNKWGGIQGGNVAMLDDAMAFAIGLTDWGQISPTLELKVSMMARLGPGGFMLSVMWWAAARSALSRASYMMRTEICWPPVHQPPIL